MNGPRRRLAPFGILVLLAVGGGYLATIAFPPGGWYVESARPGWHPSGRLIAFSFFAGALLSALAAWLIWLRRSLPASGPGLFMWAVQLIVAAGWWWVYFGLHRPGWALGAILLLWITVAMTIVLFHGARRLAAWLMLPWLIWVTVAAALNYEFWRLNGGGF